MLIAARFVEVNWNYVCRDTRCINYLRHICKQYELIPSCRPINILQRIKRINAGNTIPAVTRLIMSTVTRGMDYRCNGGKWILQELAAHPRHVVALSERTTHGFSPSFSPAARGNFFFPFRPGRGAILSGTMHIYAPARRREERKTNGTDWFPALARAMLTRWQLRKRAPGLP